MDHGWHPMRPLVDVRIPFFQPHRDDLGPLNEGSITVEPNSCFEPPQQLSRLPHVCACVLRLRHDNVWMRPKSTRRVVLLIEVVKAEF
jgi:hypothetical protein